MKLQLITTTKFKKDLKILEKRGVQVKELYEIIERLLNMEKLESKYKDHALSGNYRGFRECHVRPDWLFVYAIHKDKLILIASRTGTHSDLFGK